jgi:hypothetical protein
MALHSYRMIEMVRRLIIPPVMRSGIPYAKRLCEAVSFKNLVGQGYNVRDRLLVSKSPRQSQPSHHDVTL